MEKSVYKQLTEKEQIEFAVLWESETMKTIIKAIDIYQKKKAMDTIANSPDHENTVLNRGMNMGARFIADLAHHSFTAKVEAKKAKEA